MIAGLVPIFRKSDWGIDEEVTSCLSEPPGDSNSASKSSLDGLLISLGLLVVTLSGLCVPFMFILPRGGGSAVDDAWGLFWTGLAGVVMLAAGLLLRRLWRARDKGDAHE